jgi:hypothetical protein
MPVDMSPYRVILLHPDAPPKPAVGAACNGCGLCCAAEPCPLGMVLSRRRRGACAMLRWDDTSGRYLCGALADPGLLLAWLPAVLRPVLRPAATRMVRRWIAAQRGCDSSLQPA